MPREQRRQLREGSANRSRNLSTPTFVYVIEGLPGVFQKVEMNTTRWIVALLGMAAITAVACTQTVEEESPGQVPDVSAQDTTPAVVTDDPPVDTEPLTNQPPIISLDLTDPHRCDSVLGINACFSDGFHARDLDPDEVQALCAHVEAWLAGANESEWQDGAGGSSDQG